jgi:DNA-binding transcriptional regulator YhcF (GntR family)
MSSVRRRLTSSDSQVATLGHMNLDPEDPRPPYQQVAAAVRTAILDRTLAPGDKLPSQTELAKRYGVARMTVQQSLRILRDEGLIYSWQGSGVFVRERTAKPVGLRPHIERAFSQPEVRIDFAGYTAETLHGALTEPLDTIRAGKLSPTSIRVRLLLPDLALPLALPAHTSGDADASAAARHRMADITARHAGAIHDEVEELSALGLVETATVEARVHGVTPVFKTYIVNETDVFFGYYPVVRHEVSLDGVRQPIFDPMGKDAVLFQYTADEDPDSQHSLFVTQTRAWFESIWTTIAGERP